jgi:hypothetical protein
MITRGNIAIADFLHTQDTVYTAVTREISNNTQKMANSVEDIAQRIKRLSAV